jgi:hypothetical protein
MLGSRHGCISDYTDFRSTGTSEEVPPSAVRLDPRSSTYCLRLLSIYPFVHSLDVPDPRHHTICTGTEFWNLELARQLQANLSRPASSWGVFVNA